MELALVATLSGEQIEDPFYTAPSETIFRNFKETVAVMIKVD